MLGEGPPLSPLPPISSCHLFLTAGQSISSSAGQSIKIASEVATVATAVAAGRAVIASTILDRPKASG
jgi:hypothetical protein